MIRGREPPPEYPLINYNNDSRCCCCRIVTRTSVRQDGGKKLRARVSVRLYAHTCVFRYQKITGGLAEKIRVGGPGICRFTNILLLFLNILIQIHRR